MDVNKSYSIIAKDFDKTRFSLWPGVTKFLDTLESNTTLCDIGFGNGKYLSYRKDIYAFGCDMCDILINIANEKNPNANLIKANVISIPYRDKSFDNSICIAVLHHMKTNEDRKKVLKELVRITRKQIMISVWATEQDDKRMSKWINLGNNDYLIPYMTTNREIIVNRYYHLFSKEEVIDLCKDILEIDRIWYEKNNWYMISK